MRRIIFLLLVIAAPAFGQYVTMNGPSSVTSGDGYSVSAVCDSWLSSPYITLYKNGNYVSSSYQATDYNSNGADTGNQTISFTADGEDSNYVYFSGSLNVTVSLGQMSIPTSQNDSTTYGTNWFPSISDPTGNGNGANLVCFPPYTPWQTNGWTAPGVGTYSFYVAQKADSNHTGNNNDPSQGEIEVNGSPYTLTVNKASMTPPTANASSYTIYAGQSWGGPGINLPSGNGTGAGLWCAAGGNNWTSGSWTPSGTGTYSLYVAQKADANHTGNNTDPVQGDIEVNGSAYTLNVIAQSATFSLSGGPYTYDGTSKSVTVVPNPSSATYQISSGSLSATNAGTYTVNITAIGNYTGSSSPSWTINPASVSFSFSGAQYDGSTKSVSVSSSPAGVSYSLSGTTSAINAGTYSVTASSANSNYSGTTPGNWTLSPEPVSFSFTGGPNFAYDTNSHSVSISSVSPAGATYNTSGTWSASAAGNYTATATPFGNYTGTASYSWSISASTPVITSPTTASGTVGTPFGGYTITATNYPSSYGASGLPPGLTLSGATITGTPTTAGTYPVTISASNSAGAGNATLTITIASAGPQVDDNSHNQLNIHLPN